MHNSEGKPYERQSLVRGIKRVLRVLRHSVGKDGNTPAHTGLDAHGRLDLEDLCTAAKCKSDFILGGLRPFDLQNENPRLDFEQSAGAKGGWLVRAKWGHTLRDIVPGRDASQDRQAAMAQKKRQRRNR